MFVTSGFLSSLRNIFQESDLTIFCVYIDFSGGPLFSANKQGVKSTCNRYAMKTC